MPAAVRVEGLHELQAALAHADREVRLGVRGELRRVAEPVQRGAEELASGTIRNIGPRWSRMRVGVTRDLVYVAPRQRGVANRRAQDPRRRPNLAGLLMDRAMQPGLDRHASEIEAGFETFLDRITDNFNQGAL